MGDETLHCALCGNRYHHENMTVVVGGGAHDVVCQRCAGVVIDRTRNMLHGHYLLDGREVIWAEGGT